MRPHSYAGGLALPSRHNTLKLVARGRSLLGAAGRLLAAHPAVAKALPTGCGFAFGDVLTQQLGPLWPADPWPTKHNPAAHDATKTLLMFGAGACVGAPVSLALYRAMDAMWPGAGLLAASGKFALDQAVGCALWQAAYLAVHEQYRATLLQFLGSRRRPRRSLAVAC